MVVQVNRNPTKPNTAMATQMLSNQQMQQRANQQKPNTQTTTKKAPFIQPNTQYGQNPGSQTNIPRQQPGNIKMDDRSSEITGNFIGAGGGADIGVNALNTIQDTNIGNLGDQAIQTTQMGAKQSKEGQQAFNQGTGAIGQSIGGLNNLTSQFGTALGNLQNQNTGAYNKTDAAANQSFDYLKQAMQRNVSPEFLNMVQGNTAANENAIKDLYSANGLYGNLFLNQGADKRAQMQERGFTDSTSNAATQAELARKFNQDRAAALFQNQLSGQQQVLNERNQIGQLGTQAGSVAQGLGNLYGGIATKQGDQLNDIRGLQTQATQGAGALGNQLGALGVNQGQLGASNIQTGLGAQNQAIQDYMGATGMEAQIRMAEEILRNQLRQQNLNNQTTAAQNAQNLADQKKYVYPNL